MATQLHVVTGDQYRTIDRRMREIKRQLDQDGGSPLDPDAVAKDLQAIVEGDLKEGALPTTMTIAGRTYEILDFLREDDKGSVVGHTMVSRAKEMKAGLGQDDGRHLLDHQEEIPGVLRGKVVFVFTDWRRPGSAENVACVIWDGYRWVQDWRWLDGGFSGGCRLLRRK